MADVLRSDLDTRRGRLRGRDELGHGRGQLAFVHGGQTAVGFLELGQQRVDALRQLVRACVELVGQLGDQGVLAGVELVGALADDGIHTAHAGADRGFGHDVDRADLADVVDVGAAAQLAAPAVLADGDHAHDVAVLLTEQVHRAERDRVVELHFGGGDDQVVAQTVVDSRLDGVHHVLARCRRPLEVEAQAVRRILGSTLRSLGAELLAQGLVDHVRGGVRAGDGAAAGEIDARAHLGADGQRAFGQTALVDDEILDRLLHVVDFEHRAIVGQDLALIGELAAGLGVERRTVEDDLDVRGGADGRNRPLALLHDAEDAAASGHVGVAEEVDGLHERLLEVVVHAQVNVVALLQRIGTGTGLLLAHQLAELGLIDLDALVGRHLQRQLDREAVGVVQRERIVAGDDRVGGLLRLVDGDVEDFDAVVERAAERVLLAVGGFGDVMERLFELRVAGDHRVLGDGKQVRDHRLGDAQHAHGAAVGAARSRGRRWTGARRRT